MIIAATLTILLAACTAPPQTPIEDSHFEVVFTFESWQPYQIEEADDTDRILDDLPTVRRISVVVKGFDQNGNSVGLGRLDGFSTDDGFTYSTLGSTPMFVRTRPGLGVAKVTAMGILLGSQYDSLSCEVDINGRVVEGSRQINQITIVGEAGKGATPPVTCVWSL